MEETEPKEFKFIGRRKKKFFPKIFLKILLLDKKIFLVSQTVEYWKFMQNFCFFFALGLEYY